ncbi:MAG: trigger factor [Lachnospiraceae bacterium]|nr:trigger factor [Lachnospiraceae bacterium]
MKKKTFLVSLCLCLVLAFTGCSKSDSKQNDSNSSTESTTVESTGEVTLGEYKGIEVVMQSTEVTDEEVQARLDNFVNSNATVEEITDRTDVQDGDVANIDYVGKIGGKAFDGGSAEGTDLTIGSGTFIDGFEEQLVGAKVGETVDINVTFPENYTNADLAGKEATFTVTINSIGKSVTPELTDELVAEKTDYKTVDEYKEYVKTSLKTSKESAAQSQKELDIIDAIIENATFTNISQEEYDATEKKMRDYYESMASAYGLDLETFILYYFGMTSDKYEEEIVTAAEQAVKQQYVLEKIVEVENLTLTDEEYKTGAETLASNYNYESVEAFEEANTKEVIENSLLIDKAVQFVVENAVEVQGK